MEQSGLSIGTLWSAFILFTVVLIIQEEGQYIILQHWNRFTWRLDIPTAVIIPNITRNIPPMTGTGMVIKIAPNFPKIPRKIIRTAVVWRTNLLPTWNKNSRTNSYTVYKHLSLLFYCFFIHWYCVRNKHFKFHLNRTTSHIGSLQTIVGKKNNRKRKKQKLNK